LRGTQAQSAKHEKGGGAQNTAAMDAKNRERSSTSRGEAANKVGSDVNQSDSDEEEALNKDGGL
jgi:hypothetical protein